MLTQQEMKDRWFPLLRNRGKLYEKFLPIVARQAQAGEKIATYTSDGLETENVAEAGDYIVYNQTKAGEMYIISGPKMQDRYVLMEELEDGRARYRPIGKVWAIELTPALARELNLILPFQFIASWKAPMIAKESDFLVCSTGFSSVYRIARQEFFETYQAV